MGAVPFGAGLAVLFATGNCGGSPAAPAPVGPPKLVALVVSPRSPVVLVHDSVHFSAIIHRSDGQAVVLPTFWIASGGTISANGDFTPPDSAGEYRIIAAVVGQNLNDTVNVTVMPDTTVAVPPDSTGTPPDSTGSPPPEPPDSTPPPAPGPYPNEPQGMTPLSERGFDQNVENGWTDRGDGSFSIVQDSSAPHSPLNVGQARFAPGLSPGTGPIQTTFASLNNAQTLYVAFWMKLSSNFFGGSNNVNKILHLWIGGANKAVVAVVGTGNAALHAQVRVQNMGVFTPAQSLSWNAVPTMNESKATVRRGDWQFWEVVLVANTPGLLDGQIHYWLDGVKLGEYTGQVGWSSALQTGSLSVWQKLSWNPTWGGSGPTVPAPQFMWIDHIYISGK